MRKIYKILFIGVLGIVSASALANPVCQFSASKTPVVFFGGHNASEDQMVAWKNRNNANSAYNSRFDFEAHWLNNAANDKGDVETKNAANIAACVAAINNSSFTGKVVLMGHSDGAWAVNAIVRGVRPENRHKIKVVNLDGYASNGPEFADVSVSCWTSYNTAAQPTPPQSCSQISEGARSFYRDQMVGCKGTCRIFPVGDCPATKEGRWCLHFKLVNSNVPKDLSKDTYGPKGYAAVSPPLRYLDGILETPAAKPGLNGTGEIRR
ncbi:MAG: hypothetical protein ACXVA9_12950 [Bdellovibrionales bacterium]